MPPLLTPISEFHRPVSLPIHPGLLSSAGEFHPHALPEPDMSLSTHPAPIIAVVRRSSLKSEPVPCFHKARAARSFWNMIIRIRATIGVEIPDQRTPIIVTRTSA